MPKSLLALPIGKKAKVIQIRGGHGLQRKTASLGIRIGKTVQRVAEQPFGGPLVIEVDRARIAIGKGIAAKILVEEI